MALDIYTGYSSAFKTFVDFAQKTHADGYDSAAAKATLSSRTITVSSLSLHETSYVLRKTAEEKANDATRAIFKAAIIDMFGGEDKIPQNVKDAMVLKDYGHGKPLSSRRILAVKAAIDSNNAVAIARAREQVGTSVFQSQEVEAAARELGFAAAELPKLARATELYMQYSAEMENPPKTEMEAMREIATPGSKAARLAFYGGRFLANAENFRAGMNLLDSFQIWLGDVRDFCDEHIQDRGLAGTPTKRFMDFRVATERDREKGLEMAIFQEIAANPEINLAPNDGEAIFGMEHNSATRFFGRNGYSSMFGTILNIPPEKRGVFFAAVDAFAPLGGDRDISDIQLFSVRVLNHLDELAELKAKDSLTTKNIIKTCFPDMKNPGRYDLAALNGWLSGIVEEIEAAGLTALGDSTAVLGKMAETGCTVKEAVDSFRSGTPLKSAAYQFGCGLGLDGFADDVAGSVEGDLKRAYTYWRIDENRNVVHGSDMVSAAHIAHKLKFPDGTVFACGSMNGPKGIEKSAMNKVKELCGEVHDVQAKVVAGCLAQTVNAALRGVLRGMGIHASEHSALDYTLSKDAVTGAVTIRYSTPELLGVRCSWTCTVNTDGTCAKTPFVFEGDMKSVGKIPAWKAREMIADSEKRLGLALDAEQREMTEGLLAKYGSDLPATTARILSNYIVNIAVFGGGDEGYVSRLANDMKKWRMFTMGDERLDEMGARFVDYQNKFVKYQLDNAKKHFKDNRRPDLYEQFLMDASRGYWTINGVHFKPGSKTDDVAQEFQRAVKTPNARKVVSTLLNQKFFADVDSILYKGPTSLVDIGKDEEELVYAIKGGDMFVQKTQIEDDVAGPIVRGDTQIEYKLDVSEDGRTAYLTQFVSERPMVANALDAENPRQIGSVSVAIMATVDLTKEIPEVTNVTFAQSFTEKVDL